jgi:hypothetical protein
MSSESGTERQGSLVHTLSLGSSLRSACSIADYLRAELFHFARRGVVTTIVSRADLA